MHTQVTTQGIILKAIPYRDFHRIVTLFTPNHGLVSLVVRGAFSAKKGSGGSSTPLTTVEVTYRQKNSSMGTCEDIEIVDLNLSIRQNLPTLKAACDMLRAVLRSQQPEKEAPLLYKLLLFYLAKLPQTPCPTTLSSSFLLKTLRHEGVLMLTGDCQECQESLSGVSFFEGEFICRHHARYGGINFTDEEYVQMYTLSMCEAHSQLLPLETTEELKEKIERIFSFFIA